MLLKSFYKNKTFSLHLLQTNALFIHCIVMVKVRNNTRLLWKSIKYLHNIIYLMVYCRLWHANTGLWRQIGAICSRFPNNSIHIIESNLISAEFDVSCYQDFYGISVKNYELSWKALINQYQSLEQFKEIFSKDL